MSNYSLTQYKAAQKAATQSNKRYNNQYRQTNKLINKGYVPSKKITNYQNQSDKMLQAAKDMGNFKYTSEYMPKADNALETAQNMKFKMNYSLTDDPAYQSYRDQYVHNGQMAAQEAMGSAVANTGGFGSTAAQTAAQQAYNESLSQLNNIVPDLYNQAYNREWNQFANERDTMFQLADAYRNMDAQAYDEALSTWQNNYNQYITLANEYNARYEYMDSAERAAYEKKLDATLQMLGVAQDQAQFNSNRVAAAAEAADNNDYRNRQLAEEIRSNKASEAHNAAVLAETKRSNLASEAAAKAAGTKSGSRSSGNKSNNNNKTNDITIPYNVLAQIGPIRSNAGKKEKINALYEADKIDNTMRAALLKHYNL